MSVDIGSFSLSGTRTAQEIEMPKASQIPSVPVHLAEEKPLNEREDLVRGHAPAVAAQQVEQPQEAPQEQVEEAGEEEQSEPVAQESRSSKRFSVLARKEAQLHRERERLKAERAALDAELRAAKEFEAKKQKARLNPIDALGDLGLTYEEVSEFVVNGNKPTVSAEVQAVRDEIARLRQEQEEARVAAEQAAQERLERERELVVEQFNADAINYVEQNASKFEYTLANNASHYVPEIIEKHFFETGELLPIDKAAEIVEAHFEEVAERVAKAGKFKAKTGLVSQAQTVASTAPQARPAAAPVAKRPATLTNSMTASASAPVSQSRSEQDRIRAALARLEGK